MGHVLHDEGRINAVSLSKVSGWFLVIGPKHHTDNQKERELEENRDAAREQGRYRLLFISCGEQALHDELVRAVAGSGEASSADKSRPECVRTP